MIRKYFLLLALREKLIFFKSDARVLALIDEINKRLNISQF